MNSSFGTTVARHRRPHFRHCLASGPLADQLGTSRFGEREISTTIYWGLLKQPDNQNPTNHYPLFFTCASTSSAWPSGFTFSKICTILPSGPMRKVVRAIPITFLPYMFFSFRTPNFLATSFPASASKVYGRSCFSLNFSCAFGVSGEMPNTTNPAFCNLLYASRNPHASMVQPGVLARG